MTEPRMGKFPRCALMAMTPLPHARARSRCSLPAIAVLPFNPVMERARQVTALKKTLDGIVGPLRATAFCAVIERMCEGQILGLAEETVLPVLERLYPLATRVFGQLLVSVVGRDCRQSRYRVP